MMILHRRKRTAAVAVAMTSSMLLFSSTVLNASPAWVFLRDKGVNGDDAVSAALAQARESLSAEAISRRNIRGMNGGGMTLSDLPVASNYVNQIDALGATVRVQSRWLNAVSIDATPAQMRQIQSLGFVDHVQPVIGVSRPQLFGDSGGSEIDTPLEQTADFYGAASSQLTQINVPAVHALGYTGAGMRIGVLDSGFKRTHTAFNTVGHPLNVIAEHDFIEGDTSTAETTNNQHQHGTWVLGTMGAYQPNVLVGGAYDASFILAKTEVVPTETQVEEDYWVAGLEYLEANGADVVTSSLGYIDWYTQSQLNGQTAVTTVAALAAAQRGLVITNAAGNEGHDTNPATSHLIAPADADLLITVGAVDSAGVAASFTSDGPTADGRVKPEIMARGVAAATVRTSSDTGTTTVDGTSFATPIVASAVTLILQAHPDWTVEQLRYALFNTASRNGVFDPQYVYGYGVMNTLAAVQYSFDKFYTNASSSTFATGSNWTSAGVPIGVSNVFITPTSTLTVTGPTAATRIHRLTIGATTAGQSATLALSGGAAFTIDDTLAVNTSGRINLTSGSLIVKGAATNNGTLDLGSTAQFGNITGTGSMFAFSAANVSATSIKQNVLSVSGRVTLSPSLAPTVSRVNTLTIAGSTTPTGKLDIGKNAVVIDYAGASPLTTVAAQIAYANDNGAWDRPGITTSLADPQHGIGYAEASDLLSIPSLFGSVDSTALLIRYTLLGDTDLNGAVEFADLLSLAQNYGEIGSSYWFEGDFNYDRSVEFSDLLSLAQNYGVSNLTDGQSQSLLAEGNSSFTTDWALARSLVPEPTLGLMVVAPALGIRRQRRSK